MVVRSLRQSMLLRCTLLALLSATVSGFGNESLLIRGKEFVRKLYSAQQVDFVGDCKKELGGSAVLADKLISQLEFTGVYFVLCTNYKLAGCSKDLPFDELPTDVQHSFVSEVCDDSSTSCLEALVSLQAVKTEFGYIVTEQTEENENLINNVCVNLDSAANPTTNSAGLDLIGNDVPMVSTTVQSGNAFNIAGAATVGSALLLLVALVAGDRRKHREQHQKQVRDIESNTSRTGSSPGSGSVEEMASLRMSDDDSSPIERFAPRPREADEIFDAINSADWNRVYNLASLLAEREDVSTLSSFSFAAPDEPERSHLSLEDQQRTRTLDRLARSRDWTGVAVTAALYADESGNSSGQPLNAIFLSETVARAETDSDEITTSTVLTDLKEKIDIAVDSGDWDKVMTLSSEVEDTEELPLMNEIEFPDNVSGVKESLNKALHDGNWPLVGACANKIREMKNQPGSDSDDFVLNDEFDDEFDSEAPKKQTIAKLFKAEKWKGVSIMAGLYNMESKGEANV